jgi:hypothetical protein
LASFWNITILASFWNIAILANFWNITILTSFWNIAILVKEGCLYCGQMSWTSLKWAWTYYILIIIGIKALTGLKYTNSEYISNYMKQGVQIQKSYL